ncbi:MAG: hypothetical protein JNK17_14340 [Hydrogenophaga sp.]|nr:hypothetical protein [Hydrogenophaga sp.]
MPSSIPVQVAGHSFPSINQARLHYAPLLHKHPISHAFPPEDRDEVIGLLESAGSAYHSDVQDICSVKGPFGRRCLWSIGKDGIPHKLSIASSLKHCAELQADKCKYN